MCLGFWYWVKCSGFWVLGLGWIQVVAIVLLMVTRAKGSRSVPRLGTCPGSSCCFHVEVTARCHQYVNPTRLTSNLATVRLRLELLNPEVFNSQSAEVTKSQIT